MRFSPKPSVFSIVSLLIATQSNAESAFSATALANRIEEQQNLVWADGVFNVELDGCTIRFSRRFLDHVTPFEDFLELRLDTLDMHPNRIITYSTQLMGNSAGERWWNINIGYAWTPNIRENYDDEFTAWRQAYDAVFEEPEAREEHSLWERLFPPRVDYDAEARKVSDSMRELLHEMRAGEYGAFFQQNIGHSEFMQADGSVGLEVMEMDTSFNGYRNISPLGFMIRGDVLEDITGDLYRYQQKNCRDEL